MVAAMRAQVERGDRVFLLWLTRGEMTEALGPVPTEEIIRRRTEHGRIAGEILGVETRFLDFPDTGVESTPEAAARVARVIAEVKPDAVLTWGYAWRRGLRHPDHQATGKIVRDAITLARLKRVVDPLPPHRKPAPVFTYRGRHSQLPAVAIDASPYRDKIRELALHYQKELEFPDPEWLEDRLRAIGRHWNLELAEEYDAWETKGGVVASLLPVETNGPPDHPERTRPETL
jgi:LmbE family N-acetylglucosaminyl deacetylase